MYRHESFVKDLEIWFRWDLEHLREAYAARLEGRHTAPAPVSTVACCTASSRRQADRSFLRDE